MTPMTLIFTDHFQLTSSLDVFNGFLHWTSSQSCQSSTTSISKMDFFNCWTFLLDFLLDFFVGFFCWTFLLDFFVGLICWTLDFFFELICWTFCWTFLLDFFVGFFCWTCWTYLLDLFVGLLCWTLLLTSLQMCYRLTVIPCC